MSLWDNNRFKKKEEIPPLAWYRSKLVKAIRWPAKGKLHYILLFRFEHDNIPYKAGLSINTSPFNDEFWDLKCALLGRNPRLKEKLGMNLLYQELMILTEVKETPDFYYIGIADYRGVAD